MALVNRRVLIEYDVGGPRLWHERLVLAHVQEETYIVLTPDEDMYEEELSLLNTDIRSLRVKPANNRLPPGVVAAEVYPLPVIRANALARYQAEAQRMVGQGPGAVEVASPVQGAGGAPIMAVDIDTAEGFATGVLKWLAAEDGPGVQYGQEVQGVSIPTVRGCKHVHQGADGKQLFVECVDGADYEAFMRRPATRDIRILPVHYNALGQPERSLKEVAAECSEAKVRWTLSGPRTARWCVNYLAIENLGFEGHHERLRQVTKADASSWGIQEHFQVSMALRQALLVDQLDAYNLLTIEVQFRRLQTIEFSYSEKAKEMEAKAVGGRLSLEEQTTFGGVVRQYSTLMVCPDLLSFVKEETEKEASLAKNLRKAREEREAARRQKGGRQKEDP